jgi:hypothetical protein
MTAWEGLKSAVKYMEIYSWLEDGKGELSNENQGDL